MLRKVEAWIRQYHMIAPGDTVIVGVSGGADSVCLLSVLQELREKLDFSLHTVHVEHGIRGEDSRQDAAFVECLCRDMGIPFTRFDFDVPAYAARQGISIEEAGRRLRYEALEETADRFAHSRIAVAHNGNDQAETMLFQLARGSSVAGTAGIPPVRGKIIRPLLWARRQEIEEYLRERGLAYRTDATNLTCDYSRNKLRHKVIPVLEEMNPRAVEHMGLAALDLAELCQYLEEETERLMEQQAVFDGSSCLIRTEGFGEIPGMLRRSLLHRCIGQVSGGCRDITRRHVEAVEGLFFMQPGRSVDLPGGVAAHREYGAVRLGRAVRKDNSAVTGRKELPLEEHPDFSMRVCSRRELSEQICKKKYTKWFDYDKIKSNILVRTRQEGDFIVLDEGGGTQRLKRYFVNEKIPGARRDEILLVAEGKHILWIVGLRISAYYKVTPQTKNVLEIRYNGGRDEDE
ncbi:MAG: tRNA lysidine(34) synthetase TilS [Lachnospiraceae bacterium]|nr:tRNA lysidine(34) synthetase TilS [Lachnospiraceae bacterium]